MKQKDLSQMLADEFKSLGLEDAHTDEFGFVYASYQGNIDSEKKVALFAHIDIAADCKGDDVKPLVHENYDGGDIDLPSGLKIATDENPPLKQCLKDAIITSDGTTLLGADDKASIAEIVTLIEYLNKNSDIKHPTIKICFTLDEEIGKGVDKIDFKKIGANFGFTMDGGFPGEVNCENFDAFEAKVIFKGSNYHPGRTKDRMVSAIRYASQDYGP
jgi:tripeptide aminopeptidase